MIKTSQRSILLLDTIKKNPGIKFREIMRLTGLKNGVVSHYLGKLEKNGHIKAIREPRQARFYLSKFTEQEQKVIKALRRQTPRKLLLSLIKQDGLKFSQLVNEVKKSPSTVSIYLSQLVEDELVEIKYMNLKKRYYIKTRNVIDQLIEDHRPNLLEKPTSGFEDIFNSL